MSYQCEKVWPEDETYSSDDEQMDDSWVDLNPPQDDDISASLTTIFNSQRKRCFLDLSDSSATQSESASRSSISKKSKSHIVTCSTVFVAGVVFSLGFLIGIRSRSRSLF